MLPFIDAQSEAIGEICWRFHVERLEVFGSATGAGFDPGRSDLDFLVVFRAGSTSLENYLGLAEALEEVFGTSVDLVIERTIRNPYLRQTIDATRRSFMGTKSKKLLFDIAEACRAIQEVNAQGSLADSAADSMRRARPRSGCSRLLEKL